MPKPGTVFQLKVDDGNHFWVVISEPKGGKVLTVNVTDARNSPDSPCKLKVGDHPIIVKPSVIFYRKSREFVAVMVDEQIAQGKSVKQLPDCSPELLQRIIAGAKSADDLTLRFLDYLK